MSASVPEAVIEDILSADRSILAELLSVNPADLSVIARQKTLESGKLDLLCLHQNAILLIELKAVPFYRAIVDQVASYARDLGELQRRQKLISSAIRPIVLATAGTGSDVEYCRTRGIELLTYQPQVVLAKYYENFRQMSSFLRMQSCDYGVVRLGIIRPTLGLLSQGMGAAAIAAAEGRSIKTIRNRLSVAGQLGLVGRFKGTYYLTDLANDLLDCSETPSVEDRFSESQQDILRDFVVQNPFYSSLTYTVLSLLETVFVLAKSTYPVPREAARDYFVQSVGKEQTWRTARARETAVYIFSNYACELGFLARIQNGFYVTPKGIQAILLLQLNRSIKLIEAQE